MKYADPSVCPACRHDLPYGAAACPDCALPVRHRLAVELFGTLTRADQLVTQLRALAPAATGPAATGPAATGAAPPPPPPPPPGLRPPLPPTPVRTGLGIASVPKILLGLGALCLLVAAVTFLAVSWSVLGVAGRTVVLLGLTAAAAAATYLLQRFGLRIAAESLSTVAMGMVALDLAGADSSGWLGNPSAAWLTVIIGVVVALVGTGFAAATRPHLGAPQVVAGVGALIAYIGAVDTTSHDLAAGHAAIVAVALAAWLCHRAALPIQAWALLGAGGLAWLGTAAAGFIEASDDPALHHLWIDGAGWSLLMSAAILLLPGLILRHRDATVAGGAGAALLFTVAATLPAVDEGSRVLALVALIVTAAWTAAVAALPSRVRAVALVPASVGAVVLAGLSALTAAVALVRWAELGGPDTRALGVTFGSPDPVTEPMVAAPAVALICSLLYFGIRAGRPGDWLRYGGIATGVAALATLASYDVPLATVTTALVVLAAITALLSATDQRDGHRSVLGTLALVLAWLGCLSGLPNATLTTIGAATALAIASALQAFGRTLTLRLVTGVGISTATAATVWAGAAALDLDLGWTGVPILLILGALAIALPRLEVEVPAAVIGALAMLVAAPAATDAGGSLALHLAVAGALLAASGLLHPTRRPLIWAGLGVLLLATWVRLLDLQVTAPEPYTLPLAFGLSALGLWHLRRNPEASTTIALLPGLGLATLPSLLWVLQDPVSVRALLLGVGCLALTIGGAVLRWSAPLAVGSLVGAVLVVRELGPYAGSWPQWVWIGLAGTLLTVVGITWERRLLELRRAVGYLGRLR